uniref:Tf2-1-like SH3-like domain-containing protein n=1 Tax=Nicotiana tabacum TaxID=4097 RepID=A0A1S3Y1B0_TOBAC|nr:PREDICTED: uncharacterized protein LOC107771107 [Nicotiana tabacum]
MEVLEDHLPLIEFAYNNNYHASIRMTIYEALYGLKCRSPIGWFEVNETKLLCPDLVQHAIERVKTVQNQLLTAQRRKKSYSENRLRDLEFTVEDWVFIRVYLMKGIMRFGKKGKLRPWYIRPYQILQRIGQVSCKLDLPPELEAVRPVFHVSILLKCLSDPSRTTPIEDIQVTEDLSYEEILVAILDCQVRKLRTNEVASVKVFWRNNNKEEMTWEAQEDMKSKYHHLFHTTGGNNDTTMAGTTQKD